MTMKFDPTTVEVVGGATNRADDTWTTNGVALDWVSTCPVKGYKTDFAYTATVNELCLYYDGIGSTTELVLAKQ